MTNGLRQWVAPAYLLTCLLLGGSTQNPWPNMIVQLIGIAIIAWAAAAPVEEPLARPARQLLGIAAIGLVVAALQLVPLPASVWPSLGGRPELADGYRILGVATPAMPLSLAPYDTAATLLTIIPPVALFCAIVRLRAYRALWLALALLAGTLAGVVLGALQVASPDPSNSPWYLYPFASFGYATGFFANANHMAILLVITLPFLAAVLASARGENVQRYSAAVALVAGAALVIVIGIALNQSIAGYGLGIAVLAASALIILPRRNAARAWIALGSAALLLGAVTLLVTSPVGDRELGASRSLNSRVSITTTTAHAIGELMPFGSGLGTFKAVYRLYEDHDRLNRISVNHAHNDYLELALEMGVAGVILMALFLAWWAVAVWRAWRSGDAGPYARAASIASAAILVHSLVDFPLRTAAISTAFAMCLALLVERTTRSPDRSDLWPTRHVVLR